MQVSLSGVYKISSSIDDKIYIGSTTNHIRRWYAHCSFSRGTSSVGWMSPLHTAMSLHGIDKFKFEMIELCEPIREMMVVREQYYIDLLQPAYNIARNAGSNMGVKFSEHTRWLQSIARKGKTNVELFGEEKANEIKAKMSLPRRPYNLKPQPYRPSKFKGVKRPEEVRRKISAAVKGKNVGRIPWNKGITGFARGTSKEQMNKV